MESIICEKPVMSEHHETDPAPSPAAGRAPARAGFQARLGASIESQWERFPYYRHLCGQKGVSLDDLRGFVAGEEYHRIPSVACSAFKRSRGLVEELNDLSLPGAFQVSSNTSGDPSLVYTGPGELERIMERYRATFGIPGVNRALAFAPSLRILRALSKKACCLGKKAVLRMLLALEAGCRHYERFSVTVDVDFFKTFIGRALGKPAALRKMSVDAVVETLRDAESCRSPIAIGGVVLLLQPYLARFYTGEFSLGGNGYVAFSGGGYAGAKGAIRGDKIDKPVFFAKIAAVLNIPPSRWATNIKDLYGFTETPALSEGFWSPAHGDFVFRADPEARVYILDPETEAPLRSGRGLIKVIAPPGDSRPAAANISVLQLDEAEIVSAGEAGQVETFTGVTRFQGRGAGIEGCAFKATEIAGF